jgi:hypothetical protein
MTGNPEDITVAVTGDFSELTTEDLEASRAAQAVAAALERVIETGSSKQLEFADKMLQFNALMAVPARPEDSRLLAKRQNVTSRASNAPSDATPNQALVIEMLNAWIRGPRAQHVLAQRGAAELLGVAENDFRFVERIEAVANRDLRFPPGLFSLPVFVDQLESHLAKGGQLAEAGSPAKANRHRVVRSRERELVDLEAEVRKMYAERLSQLEMCRRLDENHWDRPLGSHWSHFSWVKAYLDQQYQGAVKAWLSKHRK